MIDVVAGIIRKENKILIARRSSHKSLGGKWEFPGGKIEQGENPKDALERELFEEFNITTTTREYFCSVEHDYQTFQIRLISFFSDYVAGEFTLIDHDS